MSIQELTLITVLFVWMGHRYPVVIKKNIQYNVKYIHYAFSESHFKAVLISPEGKKNKL